MGYGYGYGYGGWAPYVPVAERRRRAKKKMEALRKKGVDVQPVEIEGRQIANTFWGKAWCDHLESFSDFENRLPRGRTYVRNGSVCHLAIAKGSIEAKVSGSELYTVKVSIKTLPSKKWTSLKQRSAGQVGSLLELLQGKLSEHVMEVVTDRKEGLFPLPGEISFHCSCPDWASMCKHVAAVFYGIGARLDAKPELLFLLRGVNHEELIQADAEKAVAAATSRGKSRLHRGIRDRRGIRHRHRPRRRRRFRYEHRRKQAGPPTCAGGTVCNGEGRQDVAKANAGSKGKDQEIGVQKDREKVRCQKGENESGMTIAESAACNPVPAGDWLIFRPFEG